MFKTITIFLCLIIALQTSYAQDKKITNDAASVIDQIAGLYIKYIKIQFFSERGGIFPTENILEIVKINDDAVYFRTRLWFDNAHLCSSSSTAMHQGNNLFHSNKMKRGQNVS